MPIFEVSEFSILPYTQIENPEIFESFILLQVLVLYETQNLKTEKVTKNFALYLKLITWKPVLISISHD